MKASVPKPRLITLRQVRHFLSPRVRDSHKGTYGHVFVIGGSRGKTGAVLLAGRAALKVGAGLVTVVLPESAYKKVDPAALEMMYEPIDDRAGVLEYIHLKQILKRAGSASVVALGPGLGTAPSTVRLVKKLVVEFPGPLVLDADGLNAIALCPATLLKRRGPTILTPHPAEMARLTGRTTAYVQKHRLAVARDFAVRFGVVVLLKGYRSLVAYPDGKVWINPTGNPAMAQAGQGDTLTGLYAGLMAQFPDDPAVFLWGTFLHGLVGDLLAKRQRVVSATDIADHLDDAYAFLNHDH